MSADSVLQFEAAPQRTTPVEAPDWFGQAITRAGVSGFFLNSGIPVHYLSWARAGSDKPPLIFVHGFRGHARWWDFIAPFFADHYQVYAIDLSGNGDSGHRRTYTMSHHPDEILGLMDHLGLDSAILVGHSYGGSCVMRTAASVPERVERVIVVDAHVYFYGDEVPEDPVSNARQRFYSSLEEGLSRFRLAPDQELKVAYAMDYIGRNSLRQEGDRWTWKFDYNISGNQFFNRDGEVTVAEIQCPLDFVYGESSALVNHTMAERVMDVATNPGKQIAIPGAYHHIMISHPEALIATLSALL